jgi:hypothetical protein
MFDMSPDAMILALIVAAGLLAVVIGAGVFWR